MSPLIRATALVTALTSASVSAAAPEPAPDVPPEPAAPEPAAPEPAAPEPEPSPEPESEPAPPSASWVEPGRGPAPEPEPAPPSTIQVDAANYRLVLAGNILTGVGLGAFIMMTTGFLVASDGRDRLGFASSKDDAEEIARQEKRIRVGNIVGITGAAAAGALLISGLTLIGVGRTRERKRRAALESSRLVPLMGPDVAGAVWITRF